LTIHPYEHFSTLSVNHLTLTNDQLNTFSIEFANPTPAIPAGFESVLELDIDGAYMVDMLGIKDIYSTYGFDYEGNQSYIDNGNYNLIDQRLPN
jgi:hypothetical protein